MCVSKLSQLIYGVVAFFAAVLMLASMFTPGWRKIEAEFREKGTGTLINETITRGILPLGCTTLGLDGSGVHLNGTDACEQWWKEQPNYEKCVIVLMTLALVSTAAAICWNVLTFFCCIGSGGVFRPLPSLAGTASVCLLASVLIFFFNNQKDIAIVGSWDDVWNVENQNNVSYSFYLAVAALLASLLNVVVGSFVVQTAEKCL